MNQKIKVSKKMTNGQIDAIFAKFDDNGDGKMSKKEFKRLMSTQNKKSQEGGEVNQVQGESPARSRGPQSSEQSRRQAPTAETTK